MTVYKKHANGTASVKMAEASFTCTGSTASRGFAILPDARTVASVFFVFAALALLVLGLCGIRAALIMQLILALALGLIMLPGRIICGRQQPES